MRKKKSLIKNLLWFIAFFIAFLGFGSYFYAVKNEKTTEKRTLGSCKSPKQAYKETQKALYLVSKQINCGIKNDTK